MIDRANFLEMLNEIRRCVLAANGESFEFEIGEPASMAFHFQLILSIF